MKNNRGFTLIELLAVIVVLAIVIAIATSTVLPAMTSARESEFRTEATRIIKRADEAFYNYYLGTLTVKNDNNSCVNQTKACFTVSELISKGISEIKEGTYTGKIEITLKDERPVDHNLYLKKADEYYFVNQPYGDFTKNGKINDGTWTEEAEKCTC